ncbi:hypothetical protein LCI18_014770 [Fusarium solani-melongenae]|uniref:Uncharacterized protein n=1 Tax=Fusarium solani subsp. cucurbitae TaxID=2747967 RepID=A0ACD3ZRJ1_FUSSC|nr:hypothetical protein LCI18_014770 [Fusarium solani-melongenae]
MPTLSTSSSSLVHLFNTHPGSHTPIRKRAKRKRSLTQTISFPPKFIRNDESLLRKTIIPPNVPVTDLNVSTAVRALNNVIFGREGECLPSGFGYVQLSRFLGALEGRVKADRKVRLIPSISGRVNSSLVIDIYLGAEDAGPAALSTRGKISECKRIGGRWEELVGPSVFLLAIYSNVAETFVKDHSKTDNSIFKVLASIALDCVPARLLRVCVHLSTIIEDRIRSGLPCDDMWMDEVENNIRQHILS